MDHARTSGILSSRAQPGILPGMSPDRRYYVYIMASRSGVLYTGSTSDLLRRVYQHKTATSPWGSTAEYGITRLVYLESTINSRAMVDRERRIKSWRREKKVRLVESLDPGWLDLAADWFSEMPEEDPSLHSG